METIEKVYTPQTIEDQPFPQSEQADYTSTQATSDNKTSFTPQTVKNQSFPYKKQAVELLSSVINTKSRKILQTLDLTEFGGLQVGKLVPGERGDMRILGTGQIARDSAGNITFLIDGETGDAVFAGELRSGSVVTGRMLVGNGLVEINGEGDGEIRVFNAEGDAVTIIDPYGINPEAFPQNNVASGGDQNFTTTSYIDITNVFLDITVRRTTRAVFIFNAEIQLIESLGTGDGEVQLDVGGSNVGRLFIASGNNQIINLFGVRPVLLNAGTTRAKLKARLTAIFSGTPTFRVYGCELYYFLLGNG